MPRLSHLRVTKGEAVGLLMELYRKDPDFAAELEAVREPYRPMIKRVGVDLLTLPQGELSASGLYRRLIDYYSGKGEEVDPLPADGFSYMSEMQAYFDGLEQLAYKWKLRAPWAGHVLFQSDVLDSWKSSGLNGKVDICLEDYGLLYPWPPPLPPLEIKVPSWALVHLGREELLEAIGHRLKEYEDQLKQAGLKEHPSGIHRHALWWFQHYVKGMKFDQIAETECQDGTGPVISYERNVGSAVRKFSRLIGIDPKTLK
jgi:hypothetical protein